VGEAASSLPASLVGRFYRAFPHAFAQDGAWVPELLKHFSQANARAMGELAAVFVDHGQRAAFDEALAKAVRNRTAGMEVLMWACRERAGLASSAFGIDLAHAVLDCIEHDHVSGGPKRTGRMVEMLGAEESLIAQWVSQPGEEAVVGFIKRLLGTAALEELTRRSLMARVIRQRPEYEEVMAQRVSSKEDDALLVSWESLERKKAELQELVSVKIPHNNQEIQIAREEGDLRENGGYKAARDQQAVLNRMRDQLEREIGRARGTDFANVSTQVAGIGTVVTYLDLASGEQHQMTILGAWDSDLQHHVVSYLSEIAKAVTGKAVGEEAQLPGDHGPQQVRVLAITAYAKGA
jgi:transcription elongation GreA/GreB family factor